MTTLITTAAAIFAAAYLLLALRLIPAWLWLLLGSLGLFVVVVAYKSTL